MVLVWCEFVCVTFFLSAFGKQSPVPSVVYSFVSDTVSLLHQALIYGHGIKDSRSCSFPMATLCWRSCD